MGPEGWTVLRNASLFNAALFSLLGGVALWATTMQANDCTGDAEMCTGMRAGLTAGARAISDAFAKAFFVLSAVFLVVSVVADSRLRRVSRELGPPHGNESSHP